MATASRAIERVAEVTGIMPATVFRAARALREADTSLWPEGSQGRGQAAHVTNHHLVNLVLAIAVANPITTAPDVVRRYRELTPQSNREDVELLSAFGQRATAPLAYRPITMATQNMGDWPGWLLGASLGESLEQLINDLASPASPDDEDAHNFFLKAELAVGLIEDDEPSARIFGRKITTGKDTSPIIADFYHKPGVNRLFAQPSAHWGRITREATLRFDLFVALADLWDDTRKREVPVSTPQSSSQPANAAPTNENGALAGAPRTRIQDHNSIPGGDTPEPKRESENSQAQSSSDPGPPTHFMRTNPHEHSDSHPAFALVA